MKAAFLSDVGEKRENNQDYVNIFKNKSGTTFAIIADGMGGHQGGDVASDMAVSHLGHDFEDTDIDNYDSAQNWLLGEIKKENERIIEVSKQFSDLSGMGTTLVGAIILGDQMLVVNVGDSRLYLYRDGKLNQLSVDHSLVQELVDMGEISEEEAKNHPQKNVITQTLGVSDDVSPRVESFSIQIGDKILLCTDGLTNMVSEEEIADVLGQDISLENQCQILVKKANDAGGADNITVMIIEIEGSEVSDS